LPHDTWILFPYIIELSWMSREWDVRYTGT